MSTHSSSTRSPETVLDDQVVKVYVEEMESLVADVVSAHIFDASGSERWSSDSDATPPAVEVDLSAPSKRQIPGGGFAFDFPLQAEHSATLVLRLVVDSLDPPSLKFVASAVAPALECLSRQIRIDTNLTSRIDIGATNRTKLALADALNQLSPSGTMSDDVQAVLDVCRQAVGVDTVLVHLPDPKLQAWAPAAAGKGDHLKVLTKRLLEKQQGAPRPLSVRLKLPNGRRAYAVCAPVTVRRNSPRGVVTLLSSEANAGHSVAARLVASKVATLVQQAGPAQRSCSRYDLLEKIDQTLEKQTRLSHSLIYFDIDKTHAINDAFGYSTGDRALQRCQQVIADCAGAHDLVAHLGSDRFAMFLPGATIDTAVAKVDQVLRFLSQETIEDGRKSINLSASAGVACSDSVSRGSEELLIVAEVAARGARDRGGGQHATFQDVDNSIIQRRTDVDKVGFLQTALIENKFTLFAQRILPINTTMTHKFELLARLNDPGIDNGSAHQFLAAAERYQMMAALDRWVINSALKTLSEADNQLEVSLSTFAINVSAQSLRDDTFVDHIEAKIADTGVPPDALCFEITETSLVRNIDRALHFVSRLQRLGCQVALDDFGTGYSSFAYLKTLPINVLKIDGSFVRDIMECPLSKTIVSSVVRMAEDIGAQTVAEHVENELVRALLKELGVHYIQGYVAHRPEPLENILVDFESSLSSPDESCENIDLRSESLELLLSSASK